MSRWSNMFLMISEEPDEWRHKPIFCWTGAWQELSTWLSFHLHHRSRTQQTMTGIHVVPKSRTQVQCDCPALRTEQLRVPAAFSLPPAGSVPEKDTSTSLNGSPPSCYSFLLWVVGVFFPVFCLSSVSILFLCCDGVPRSTSDAPTQGDVPPSGPLSEFTFWNTVCVFFLFFFLS